MKCTESEAIPDEKARRSPRGERGLKSVLALLGIVTDRRSPRGERGLKYADSCRLTTGDKSLPSRGAWIEMSPVKVNKIMRKVAPLAGSVD